jgi:heat shock protein HslJ
MKLKFLAIALFPLTLAACQTADLQKAGDLAVSVLQQQNANKTLASYQWSTDTGAPKPLVLNFSDDNRLSINTSCNTMASSWKVESNIIETGTLMSTMMACSGDLMKQEGIAGQIFESGKTAFKLNLNDVNTPTLTLTAKNGTPYVFTGKMTPETKYQTQGETIFLEVSPETKKCTGVAPQTCLQVREVKYADNGVKTQVDKDWTLFYNQIEGFEHRPNERQIIRVKRYEIKNPAADQSKYAYVYDMAVEREAIKGSL